jgi:MFS family permease
VTAATESGWPQRRAAWTIVAALTAAQFVNAIDRHLIGILIGPIKQDLHITDSNVGQLALAFSILYALMGLVAGRWADSLSRKTIIACGAAVWSVMTVAFGLARSLPQLALARMGVGAGEATLNPSGYSMIADCFPPAQRATPMGVFVAGSTLGQAFTLFAAGALIQHLTLQSITWATPWGDVLRPWQIAFVCAGLPGILIVLLMLAIREPARRELLPGAGAEESGPPAQLPLLQVARHFSGHWRLYAPIYAGFGMLLMWELGKALWAPSLFSRSYGWQPARIGLALGSLTLVFGSAGLISAGRVAEWFARRGHSDAYLRAALIGAAVGLPFAALAPQMPTPALALCLFAPAYFCGNFPVALAPALLSTVTPNQMRAQITALYLAAVNLLGAGIGPLYIGTLTDHVFHDDRLLKHSLSLAAATMLPLGMLLLWIAMRQLRAHRGIS